MGNGGLTGASSGDAATTQAILPDRFNENSIFDTDLLSVRVETSTAISKVFVVVDEQRD